MSRAGLLNSAVLVACLAPLPLAQNRTVNQGDRLVAATTHRGPMPRDTILVSGAWRSDATARRCLDGRDGEAARPRFAEVHAASDPTRPDHLVAAWQVMGGESGAILVATSWDGGATWSTPQALPISACAGGPAGALRASDPSVAIGADGVAYVGALAWRPGEGGAADGYNAIVVVASADGGRLWGPPVLAALADPAVGISHDNVSLVTDPRRPGALYLATTRYAVHVDSSGRSRRVGAIGFTRSSDHGRSWEPLATISSPPLTSGRVSAPQLVMDDRAGRLMVFYLRIGGGARFAWQYSDDQGTTWRPEERIVDAVQSMSEVDSLLPGGRSFALAPDIVSVAVDSKRGAYYLAYADGRRDPRGRPGISIAASFDRGGTWRSSVDVSPDNGLSSWLPAVALYPDGNVAVAYLAADLGKAVPTPAIAYHLRVFGQRGGAITLLSERLLGTAPVGWPGDYHALVPRVGGVRLLTVRAASSGEGVQPTEVVAH